VRNLKDDFYSYDRSSAAFRGQRTKHLFQIGNALFIRVQTANATTGSLIFELAGDASSVPNHPLRDRRTAKKHKPGPATTEDKLRERKKARGKNRNKHKRKPVKE